MTIIDKLFANCVRCKKYVSCGCVLINGLCSECLTPPPPPPPEPPKE